MTPPPTTIATSGTDVPVADASGPHFAPPLDDACLSVPFDYPPSSQLGAPTIAVIWHVFYVDLVPESQGYLRNIPYQFDLFITTDCEQKKRAIQQAFDSWRIGRVEIRLVPNRGRDIAPKLVGCRDVHDAYEYVLHIHTKKSAFNHRLEPWRRYLFDTLVGSRETVASIFEAFHLDPKLGVVAPQHFPPMRKHVGWGGNFLVARKMARRMGIDLLENGLIDFPSGSMFWARSCALERLLQASLVFEDFEAEQGQNDGTLGHAIERLYFHVCEASGYKWIKVHDAHLKDNVKRIVRVASPAELKDFLNRSSSALVEVIHRDGGAGEGMQYASRLPSAEETAMQLDPIRAVYERSDFTELGYEVFRIELMLHRQGQPSLIDFEEAFYLAANPDVAEAVRSGAIASGYEHFCLLGSEEDRPWSNKLLRTYFSMAPHFPVEGLFKPVNLAPIPRHPLNLSHLQPCRSSFLLLMVAHLQEDLFFAGYGEFFRDLAPLFERFEKIVVAVKFPPFNSKLAQTFDPRIEVVSQPELEALDCKPGLVVCFNAYLLHEALEMFDIPDRTIYYCQDFEASFEPLGDNFIHAARAVTRSRHLVVSTRILCDYLQDRGLITSQNVHVTSPQIETLQVTKVRSHRLFFYFRPEAFQQRNLSRLLMDAVHRFCQKHQGYEIYLVGSARTTFSFEINGTAVYVINKLSRANYENLISSCDVVVSMIYSAHPGVIAYQTAGSGIPTVTNTFDNRDAALLKAISQNLVCFDPLRDDLVTRIEEALNQPKGYPSLDLTRYAGTESRSLLEFVDNIMGGGLNAPATWDGQYRSAAASSTIKQ